MRLEYPVTTGAEAFYANKGTSLGMNHGVCHMNDPVSRDDLQCAVETAMQRFPYYRTRAVIQNGSYVLVPNDAPIVVYEQPEPIAPGDERLNGYLVTFGCWGNDIFCDFFAGAAGGRGAMAAAQSALYYYCLYHYGDVSLCPGVMLAEDTPLDEEYADPYGYVHLPQQPVELLSAPDGFVLPEERVEAGKPQMMYSITLPQEAFIRYTKANDGSPAVMTALLLCRAIDEVHPVREKPVSIFMPMDASAALGCRRNMQNCLSEVHLTYSDRVRALPLDRQATCFRGMVFLQADPDRLLEVFAKRKALYRRVMAAGDMEAKRTVYLTWAPRYVLPSVSYVGKLDFGDVDKHRGIFRCMYDASVKGIMAEAFTAGDSITIGMACGLKTDANYKAFLHQLTLAGIPFKAEEPMPFIPMQRTF